MVFTVGDFHVSSSLPLLSQGLVYAKKALHTAQASPHNKDDVTSIEDLIQTLSQANKAQ